MQPSSNFPTISEFHSVWTITIQASFERMPGLKLKRFSFTTAINVSEWLF